MMHTNQMLQELSLSDLISAANHTLDAHDTARGYEPEPGDCAAYDDGVIDLVHRVALNLCQFAAIPAPTREDIAKEISLGSR